MLEARQFARSAEVVSLAEARDRLAAPETYLFVALDQRAARALRVFVDRIGARGELASLADRVVAFELLVHDARTARTTVSSPEDEPEVWRQRFTKIGDNGGARVGVVELAQAVWNVSRGAPDVVVVFLGSAEPEDARRLDEERERALAALATRGAPAHAVLAEALGLTRSLAILATASQAAGLDGKGVPGGRKSATDLGTAPGASPPRPAPRAPHLVVLELAGGGGLASERIARSATAEMLELLVELGPTRLLGIEWASSDDPDTAVVVAIDGIEVPSAMERRYLSTRVRRKWLDVLLVDEQRDAEASRASAHEAAREIVREVDADRRRLEGRARKVTESEGKRAALDVEPGVLRALPTGAWADVIAQANLHLADPEGPVARTRARLAQLYEHEGRVHTAVRALAMRLLSEQDRGLLQAERALASAAAWLDQRVHSVSQLTEPRLRLDEDALGRIQLEPPGGDARLLAGWTALLILTTFAALGAAGVVATIDTFVDTGGFIALAVLLWQAGVLTRYGIRIRLAAAAPGRAVRDLFHAWGSWFVRRELELRSLAAVSLVLDEIVLLRERLARARDHLSSEERRLRRTLAEPAFPARISHIGADLDEVGRELEERFGLGWLMAEAGNRSPSDRGRWLLDVLESSILGSPNGASSGSIAQRADAAVSQLLEARAVGSLEKTLVDPVRTLSMMRRRTRSTGQQIVAAFLCANERSGLLPIGERLGLTHAPRHDPDRATVAVVSRLAIGDGAW